MQKSRIPVLASHTSNCDFFGAVYGYLPILSFKFATRKGVVIFPLSYLMRALGAIPIIEIFLECRSVICNCKVCCTNINCLSLFTLYVQIHYCLITSSIHCAIRTVIVQHLSKFLSLCHIKLNYQQLHARGDTMILLLCYPPYHIHH